MTKGLRYLCRACGREIAKVRRGGFRVVAIFPERAEFIGGKRKGGPAETGRLRKPRPMSTGKLRDSIPGPGAGP